MDTLKSEVQRECQSGDRVDCKAAISGAHARSTAKRDLAYGAPSSTCPDHSALTLSAVQPDLTSDHLIYTGLGARHALSARGSGRWGPINALGSQLIHS